MPQKDPTNIKAMETKSKPMHKEKNTKKTTESTPRNERVWKNNSVKVLQPKV